MLLHLVEQALAVQALGEFVGEFEKPRYVAFEAGLCAHSRAKKTGCTNCIEACSTEAIRSHGDVIAVDPWLCKGCGTCVAACPSGSIGQHLFEDDEIFSEIAGLLAPDPELTVGANPGALTLRLLAVACEDRVLLTAIVVLAVVKPF